jgi:hypothetical protein
LSLIEDVEAFDKAPTVVVVQLCGAHTLIVAEKRQSLLTFGIGLTVCAFAPRANTNADKATTFFMNGCVGLCMSFMGISIC